MTGPHFNLIVDPWLRLATPDATVTEASIETAFRNSRSYTGLASGFAPEDAAVTRVLISIIYRAYKGDVPDADDLDAVIDFWESLVHAPSLWTPQVEDYLAKYRERFFLSGAKPFMLTPELDEEGKDIFKPVTAITSPGIDQFSTSTPETLTPAEVARAVICAQSYDRAGNKTGVSADPRASKGKATGAKLSPAAQGATTVVTGATLHETLLLNYVPYLTKVDDTPPWEREHPGLSTYDAALMRDKDAYKKGVAPAGPVDSMTWQSRRINIRWNEDGNADGVVISTGDPLDSNALFGGEPMSPFRFSDSQSDTLKTATYRASSLEPDRESWSKLGGFLPETTPRTYQGKKKKWHGTRSTMPAETIKWVKTLVNEGVLDSAAAHLRAHAVSVVYGTQSSIVVDVIEAGFPVPKSAMENDAINDAVFAAVNTLPTVMFHVESFYRALTSSPSTPKEMTYGDGGRADKRAVSAAFESWLEKIGEYDGDADSLYEAWAEKTLRTVEAYADKTISTLPTRAFVSTVSDGKHIEHPMKARSTLRYRVEKALGLRKEDYDQKDN